MNKAGIEKKKILITAKNSYVGNSFANWVKANNNYSIDFISCRTNDWKHVSFSSYDVILHVAGIAHVDAKSDQEALYYKVNRDLTIELAKKAKLEGVKQFIFMSSMIVFGESNSKLPNVEVTKQTKPNPSGFYGDSKLQAEMGITSLQDEIFNVVIIRPPMIYGKGSKGNFPKLVQLAKKAPIFPNIDNKRSMLYIDNLSEFIKLMIHNDEFGIFHPQNKEYVNTSDMVNKIGNVYGKKIVLTKLFNPLIISIGNKVNTVNKVFGTFTYEKEMSIYKESYWVSNLENSLLLTERSET
ncbi:UDP-glucose 4-epimerase [Paenibacillus castaneae]|uniref:NAD-dependent epimerase/dehydratase family protein n=1 Tax=Paenibacillus castaneae TaxID=474957 RepID=UPI000C99C7C1|nr:NAD-dependent epimerase/dehydratase family protein [Paenibacillus castaneae]NIK78181.1 UDP-glucose 4-epimerase [Paenibacillus castaneae]